MADITVTIPDNQIPRLKAAMDEVFDNQLAQAADPANPTNAEYLAVLQNYIITDLKQIVRSAEVQIARRAAIPSPDEIEIT